MLTKIFQLGLLALSVVIVFSCEFVPSSEPSCMPPAWQPLTLNPDSLTLIPHSASEHYSNSSGVANNYNRILELKTSGPNGSAALSSLDSNHLSLFVGERRMAKPGEDYEVSRDRCGPVITESIIISGTAADTTIMVELRMDNVPIRNWRVEYKYDSAISPSIDVREKKGGLSVTVKLKPGVEISDISIGDDITGRSLPIRKAGDTLATEINFEDIDFLRYPTDSAELSRKWYHVCVYSDSTLESIKIDDELWKGTTNICFGLEGGKRDSLIKYAKQFCQNCK